MTLGVGLTHGHTHTLIRLHAKFGEKKLVITGRLEKSRWQQRRKYSDCLGAFLLKNVEERRSGGAEQNDRRQSALERRDRRPCREPQCTLKNKVSK